MMDEQDAMDTLTFIVVRLVTRAAKAEARCRGGGCRKRDECVAMRIGAAQAAKRAKIAARPVKVRRSVDNLGRSHVW